MNEIVDFELDTTDWDTVCVGLDWFKEGSEVAFKESNSYEVIDSTLILNAEIEGDQSLVNVRLRALPQDDFFSFSAGDGLYEVTDEANSLLTFSGASKLSAYVILEYGPLDDSPFLPVSGYTQARFRVFASEDSRNFEVALLLS